LSLSKILILAGALVAGLSLHAQEAPTSTDVFVMAGSDFSQHGAARSNLNIGAGHSFNALSKVWIGNEITAAYTYENAGTHGWWHTDQGSHTESFGDMRNFPINPHLTTYTWVQLGITTLTGTPAGGQNRLYDGESLGAIIPFSRTNSIWVQESYNKVVTQPWYTTTSIGYTRSF
jgi:hypothetical protein